jgi:hypothetical protein
MTISEYFKQLPRYKGRIDPDVGKSAASGCKRKLADEVDVAASESASKRRAKVRCTRDFWT